MLGIKKLFSPLVQRKLLIGTHHGNEQEQLEDVLAHVTPYWPANAGIEIPDGYKDRRARGSSIFFFSELAQRLEEKGVMVVPLESYDLYMEGLVASTARHAWKDYEVGGRQVPPPIATAIAGLEHLQEKRRKANDGFHPPETSRELSELIARQEKLIDVLDRCSDFSSVTREFFRVMEEIEACALKRIRETYVPLVVVGSHHAARMHPSMPEYELIQNPATGTTAQNIAEF